MSSTDIAHDAVDVVNRHLHVDGARTDLGNEIKVWVYDQEHGGRCKAYLSATDCRDLARAFAALSQVLRATDGA